MLKMISFITSNIRKISLFRKKWLLLYKPTFVSPSVSLIMLSAGDIEGFINVDGAGQLIKQDRAAQNRSNVLKTCWILETFDNQIANIHFFLLSSVVSPAITRFAKLYRAVIMKYTMKILTCLEKKEIIKGHLFYLMMIIYKSL